MKKIKTLLVVAGIIMIIFPVSTLADDTIEEEIIDIDENFLGAEDPGDDVVSLDKCTDKIFKLRGKWGYQGDNLSDGFFGGYIKRRPKCGLFRGLVNSTENEEKFRLVGIMRHGYFNGRVIIDNETFYPVTGLYKVNRDEGIIKLKWMTPRSNGWAVARLLTPEN